MWWRIFHDLSSVINWDIVTNERVYRKCFQMCPLWSSEHDFHNGIAAAGCVPGYSGLRRLPAIHTVPSWESDGRAGAELSKITTSRAQQQLHQHEGSAQRAWPEQLFPQQCCTGEWLHWGNLHVDISKTIISPTYFISGCIRKKSCTCIRKVTKNMCFVRKVQSTFTDIFMCTIRGNNLEGLIQQLREI